MQIKVMQVGQLGTNCYLLEDEETRTAAVVDPGGEGARILAQLKADGMELKLILLTHAHFDHTGGVAELCAALPRVPVYLHPADAALVGGDVFPAVGAETTPYQDGDVVKLGKMDIEVLHTPGHTPGEVSLYVGIPFCPTRCAYCSFVSADVGRALKLIDPFLDALCRELAATGAMLADAGLRVRTVYFGGGTPTTLSAPQLDRLMGELADHIDLSGCTEYTVEAGRPDTITAEKLAVLARRGCSRVSVNPQTMQDAVLERMGRAHRADDILRAYALARESGIGCINMDLIAGLPGDSAAGFRASLEQVLALGPENVTVHTLALKKGSRLMEEGGGLPSGAAVADMLDFAWAALRAAGQRPYYLYRQKYMSGSFENVGWCRPGAESLYNICMMEELHTIVSLGGGGVTKLVDRATGYIERLANAKYPQEYIQKIDAICADKARVAQFYAAHGR